MLLVWILSNKLPMSSAEPELFPKYSNGEESVGFLKPQTLGAAKLWNLFFWYLNIKGSPIICVCVVIMLSRALDHDSQQISVRSKVSMLVYMVQQLTASRCAWSQVYLRDSICRAQFVCSILGVLAMFWFDAGCPKQSRQRAIRTVFQRIESLGLEAQRCGIQAPDVL